MSNGADNYPIKLAVNYPCRSFNGLKCLLRIFAAIPMGIFLLFLSLPVASFDSEHGFASFPGFLRIIFFPVLIVLFILRRNYPDWLLEAHKGWFEFCANTAFYVTNINDRFSDPTVHIEITKPVVKNMSWWLPLVKWFLATPHYVALVCLWTGMPLATFFALCAVTVTGRYPEIIYQFITGVVRWSVRVESYALLLVTDIYPPFSLA